MFNELNIYRQMKDQSRQEFLLRFHILLQGSFGTKKEKTIQGTRPHAEFVRQQFSHS